MGTAIDLDAVGAQGVAALQAAQTLDELNQAKAEVFGKKSALSALQRELGGLDEDARRELGQRVNALRETLTSAEAERRRVLTEERDRVVLGAERIDVTLPTRVPMRGSLHPVVETMEAMVDALIGLGYEVIGGPEVESDWFNFDALNMPPNHPARSLWDTIYVHDLLPPSSAGGLGSGGGTRPPADGDQTATLLRTHTSPVQARTMLQRPAPVFVAVPGRTFRSDTPDATHLPVFHQIEGLAVAEGLSFADLRGTLAAFCRALLGPDTTIRLRPSYFPFTEPSAEVDAWYVPPGGEGRWIELLGCGMVNPNVFRAVGYDPEQVRGFAFGIGVERMAMLRHGIGDLRLFIENDLRFLSAF